MELTGKQKRYLRSLGNRLETHITLGHSGLNDNSYGKMNELIKKNELIKIRLNKALGIDRKEAAKLISAEMDAETVQIFGSTLLMYRQNEDQAVIKFPKPGKAPMKRFFDDDEDDY